MTDRPSHLPTCACPGLFCRDGERGQFETGADDCKRCGGLAMDHWNSPPVCTRSGR